MFNMRNCSLKMGVSSVCAAAFGRHSQPLKNLLGIGHQQTRSISRTNCVTASKRDYYAELRVARTATQEEIKTAFYDLSKMYHPDTATAEPEVAAQKFVQVAEAYEVLGNAKARKTYDMENDMFSKLGYGPGMESEFGESGCGDEEEEEDDDTTRFYRQHMRRTQVPGSGNPEDRKFNRWMNRSLPSGLKRK